MSSCRKAITIFVFFSTACVAALSQTLINHVVQSSTTSAGRTSGAGDAYGRTTPAGTVLGFLQAAQSGKYSIAAQYLQMSPARRQSEGEEIARKLKQVMDCAYAGNLKNISTEPEGTPQEGVPPDRQKIGAMSSRDVEAELELVHVSDPAAGKIWLIASDTLTKVPELYDHLQACQVETQLPSVLVKRRLAGMPLWQWLAMLLAIPVAAVIGWLVLALLEVPLRWWARRRGQPDVANWRSVSGPAWLLAGTLTHQVLTTKLGMPLLQRHYYYQVTTTALIVSTSWLFWHAIRWFLRRVRSRALSRGQAGTGSLMLLGERILKAVVFVMAVLWVLGNLGFNMSTALAGVGIGGLAIGFGAQKTIENLFGGVSVLGDEVIRVGDVCRFGDRTGVVEDIGLRSTRVRTEDRTLLVIPNGTVATINVENFTRREKILFKTNLGLRSDSKPDHVRFVLAEVRRLLYSHAKVETDSARVRLTDVDGSSHTVEIFAYVLTQDANEYAAIREDLLLRMMDVIDESGSALAVPSQTLYLGKDAGLEKEKAEAAAKQISDLREGKQLPFPDHHKDDIAGFKGTIQYPQADSAVSNDKRGSSNSR